MIALCPFVKFTSALLSSSVNESRLNSLSRLEAKYKVRSAKPSCRTKFNGSLFPLGPTNVTCFPAASQYYL